MNSLVHQIDEEIEQRSLLKHPFYEMWSKGKLTRDHLSGYSLEYFQLVKAVPEMVKQLEKRSPSPFRRQIRENWNEESAHVQLWTRFARSMGIPQDKLLGYAGLPGTLRAVDDMKLLTRESLEAALGAMYAYERDLPKISTTKLRGLKEFYGLESADALDYFREHETADVKHAAVWRKMLEDVPEEKSETAKQAAIRSLESQNKLLDSVMDKYVD
jgi:pyrroloquinoline-quinone synthase